VLLSEITTKWPLQYVYHFKANTGLLDQYSFLFVFVEFLSDQYSILVCLYLGDML
jgi:hypothetical protein